MSLIPNPIQDQLKGGGANHISLFRESFSCLTHSTLGCNVTAFTRGGIRNVPF